MSFLYDISGSVISMSGHNSKRFVTIVHYLPPQESFLSSRHMLLCKKTFSEVENFSKALVCYMESRGVGLPVLAIT